MTTIVMKAPAPGREYTNDTSGNSYTADAFGIISAVYPEDVNALESLGCLPLSAAGYAGLPWVSGRFYGLPAGVTPVSFLTVASTLYAYPIFIPNSVTLAALQADVITGQTGGKVELGIYADNGAGYPGALVAGTDTGDLDGTTNTTIVGPTNLAVPLSPGWYWAAIQAAATSTMPSIAGSTVGYTNQLGNLLGSDSATHLLAQGSEAPMAIKKTSVTYAALPANFPAGAAIILNSGAPLVSLGV